MMGLVFFLKEKLSSQHVFLPVKIQVCCPAMQKHKLTASSSALKEDGEDHLPTALYSFLKNHSHH